MNKFPRYTAPALVALLLAGGTSYSAEPKVAPNLDAALREQGPKLLDILKKKNYANVGVLKFLVGNEGGKTRDDYGPLNRSLADRLELALLLALKEGDKLNVIFRASDVVKDALLGATHLTAKGREQFFTIEDFTLPWNTREKVMPDAFLTGEAWLSADLRYIDVVVKVFDKRATEKLTVLTRFRANVDFRTLTEAGVSFAGARGPIDELGNSSEVLPAKVLPKDQLPKTAVNREEWQAQGKQLLDTMEKADLQVKVLYRSEDGQVQRMNVEVNPFSPPHRERQCQTTRARTVEDRDRRLQPDEHGQRDLCRRPPRQRPQLDFPR